MGDVSTSGRATVRSFDATDGATAAYNLNLLGAATVLVSWRVGDKTFIGKTVPWGEQGWLQMITMIVL